MNKNPLGIKRFGPIVFFVADAQQEAVRLAGLLGMQQAYIPSGTEQVFGLVCDDTTFILDGGKRAQQSVKKHGNHVHSVGMYVESVDRSLAEIQNRTSQESGKCSVTGAGFVQLPHDGEVVFRFLETDQLPYPGIQPVSVPALASNGTAFQRIDHIVTNTQKIKPVIEFYRDVLGMEKVNEFTIRVETESFSASLYSEVMGLVGIENEILFPVNEPLPDDTESQIPAQLKSMGRSHVQHIALATDNIIASIENLRDRGLGFLEFRNEEHARKYYESVPQRLGDITVSEAMEALRSLGILVDKCGEGYLLQLFSKRLFPERSVPFVEIIQRASDVIGCFGDGNFAALAESLEHSMRLRDSGG